MATTLANKHGQQGTAIKVNMGSRETFYKNLLGTLDPGAKLIKSYVLLLSFPWVYRLFTITIGNSEQAMIRAKIGTTF